MTSRTAIALRFTLLLWVGSLFALLGLQRLFADSLSAPLARIAVFIFQVAPLLAIAPILLRPGPRGALWLCLLMPLYFTHGIWQYGAADSRIFGIFEVVFALGAFISGWLLLRLLPRHSAVREP
jgi:uncharacterized membrane protein